MSSLFENNTNKRVLPVTTTIVGNAEVLSKSEYNQKLSNIYKLIYCSSSSSDFAQNDIVDKIQ